MLPMSLRTHLRALLNRLIPSRAVRELLCEHQNLSALGTIRCDPANLRDLTNSQIEGFFQSEEIRRELKEAQDALDRLALPELTGGVNPGDQRAIYCLIRCLKPRRILEIGTHIGCSTVNVALAMKRLRSLDKAARTTLVSVDIRDVNDEVDKPWKRAGAKHSPRQMIDMLGCGEFVNFVVAPSLDFLASGADGQPFDFVFLDGDHSARTVYQELPAALRRLAADGVVLLHDYFPDLKPLWPNKEVLPGVFLAVQRLLNEGAVFDLIPLGQLPWPTKLGSNVTSLALVVRPKPSSNQ